MLKLVRVMALTAVVVMLAVGAQAQEQKLAEITVGNSKALDVINRYGSPDYVGPSIGAANDVNRIVQTPTSLTPPGASGLIPGTLPTIGRGGYAPTMGMPGTGYPGYPGAAGTQPSMVPVDRNVYLMYERGGAKLIFGIETGAEGGAEAAIGVVTAIMIVGDSYPTRTSKGVTLGDGMEKVMAAHGYPDRQRYTAAGLTLTYEDQDVVFTLRNMRVRAITVSSMSPSRVGVSVQEPQLVLPPGTLTGGGPTGYPGAPTYTGFGPGETGGPGGMSPVQPSLPQIRVGPGYQVPTAPITPYM